MNRTSTAGIAALIIGLVSIAAGSRVLLGLDDPGYLVVVPLVWYNIAAGVVSVAAGAALLARRPWARGLAWGILGAHGVVLVTVAALSVTTGGAATESAGAMAFRVVIWIVIVLAASPGARHTT